MKLLAIISLLFIAQFSNAYTQEDKCTILSEYIKIASVSRYVINNYPGQYRKIAENGATSKQLKVVMFRVLKDMYAKRHSGSYSNLASLYHSKAANYSNEWFGACIGATPEEFKNKLDDIDWKRISNKVTELKAKLPNNFK